MMHNHNPVIRQLFAALRAQLANAGVTRMHPLIQLRWIAVVGQLATILFVHFVLAIELPLANMAVVLALLTGYNLFSMWRWRDRDDVSHEALFLSMLVDVFALTAQLYLSGGADNPFAFLYLLQVVLAAVLLPPWASWTIAATTGACFLVLAIRVGPVTIPAYYHVVGLLICFVMNAALVVMFINRINSILRRHDEHLTAMQQRATEEEHIVRMGLLASGAAHELGTPLATISVLLGDWQRTALFREHPDLQEDAAEMQGQVNRCKSIISGILMSAGRMRAESPEHSRIETFLDDLVQEWQTTRPVHKFVYNRSFSDGLDIIVDEGLKQTICNVLDNALEASPLWVSLEAINNEDSVIIRVMDRGPGFTKDMLMQFGRPYQSTKGKPGSGLGLFLSVNVTRALGGNIVAQNLEQGGAIVTIVLPLSSLMLESNHDA